MAVTQLLLQLLAFSCPLSLRRPPNFLVKVVIHAPRLSWMTVTDRTQLALPKPTLNL